MADIRVFVALELPGAIGQQVGDVAQHLRHLKQVKWVKPEGAHLTLKFLGDVDEQRVSQIISVVQEVSAKFKPLMLSTNKVGGFPKLDNARVLWLGVGGDLELLSALQGEIETGLDGLGFKPERRKFMAHITVGRARRKPVCMVSEDVKNWRPIHFSIDRVSVMKSDLRPDGAVYTALGYGMLGGV